MNTDTDTAPYDSFTVFCLEQRDDPRRPLSICWSSYWRQAYTVLDITCTLYGTLTYTVFWWEYQCITKHSTPWKAGRDILITHQDQDSHA